MTQTQNYYITLANQKRSRLSNQAIISERNYTSKALSAGKFLQRSPWLSVSDEIAFDYLTAEYMASHKATRKTP